MKKHTRCFRKSLLFLVFSITNLWGVAQLNVTTGFTADQYVARLIGGGITYSNVVYSGNARAIGNFETGAVSTNLGINSGFMLSTGFVNSTPAIGNASTNFLSIITNGGSDPDLQNIVAASLYDASVLEFDFIPMSDTIRFRYVFGSEEYPEYVCSKYNDVFGFFLSGPNPLGGNYNKKNIAIIPGTNLPVAINSVNPGVHGTYGTATGCTSLSYSNQYVDNSAGTSIVFDGFTYVFTSWAVVVPCQQYHIKLAIADVGDGNFDSGVFFEENSFYSPSLNVSVNYPNPFTIGNFATESGCIDNNVKICFNLDKALPYNTFVNYSLSGTAQEGVDYHGFPSPIVIPAGQTSFCHTLSPFQDDLIEGTESLILASDISMSCKVDTTVILILDYQPLEANISNDTLICSGSAQISVSALNGLPPYTYNWSNGLPAISSHSVSPTNNTTYSVTISDACNNSIVKSVTVNVDSANVDLGHDIGLCYAQSVEIKVTTNVSNLVWSNGSTSSSIIVSPTTTTTYSVTATSQKGCVATDDVVVSIFPLPSVDAGSSKSICVGESAQLNGSGALIYSWSPAATLNNPNIANPIATPTTTTTYYLTGATAGGNIINNGDFEQGNIGFYSDYNYNNNLVPEGNYYISSNPNFNHPDFASCSDHTPNPANKMMIVNGAPIANQKVWCKSLSINQNTDYAFSTWIASVHLSNPAVLQFSINGSLLGSPFTAASTTCNWQNFYEVWNSGSNSVAEICIVNQNTIKVGNDFALDDISFAPLCENIDSVTVFVNPIPILSVNKDTICVAETAILTATSDISGSTFLWNTGATTASINVSPTSTTTYNVTVTSPDGCVSTGATSIVVNPLPTVSVNLSDSVICVGESVVIKASSDIVSSSFAWSIGSSSNQIMVSPIVTTTYALTVTSPEGCITKSSATIYVNLNPAPSLTLSSAAICLGSSASISCNTDIAVEKYLWSTGEDTSVVVVSPSEDMTYSITVSTANGCKGSAEISLVVNSLPEVKLTANKDEICLGESSLLSGLSENLIVNYSWSTGQQGVTIEVSPNLTSSYFVVGTDVNGCIDTAYLSVIVNELPELTANSEQSEICEGSTTKIFVNSTHPNTNYVWSCGQTNSEFSINPIITTTYTVIGTNENGCVGKAEITVTVNKNPIIIIGTPNIAICKGDSAQLNVSSQSAVNYVWSTGETSENIIVSPQNTLIYTVTGTDNNGCIGTSESNVLVRELPIITIKPNNPNICHGESVTLNASGAMLYNWAPEDGLNSLVGDVVTSVPDSTIIYTIVGIDLYGCSNNTTVKVVVNPIPIVDFSADERDICMETIVHFTGIASPDIQRWQWNFGGSSLSAGNTSYIQNPLHTFFETGNYFIELSVITSAGCKNSIKKPDFIVVHPNPIASFARTPDITTIEKPVINFYNQSLGEKKYLWNFDDPSSGLYNMSVEKDPVHKYSIEGEYWVTLYVENEWGCFDTTKNRIIINPEWSKFIPTAFTPNGDSKNDYFRPIGFNIDYSEYSMFIYDRWGKEIFATHDIEDAWDGRVNRSGEVVPQDVYVYLIILKDVKGIEHQFIGHVTVVK